MSVCEGCLFDHLWTDETTTCPKECEGCQIIDGKPTNYKPKTKTNADRIRAMSDDELAKFICEWCNCVPGYCPGLELCTPSMGKANGLVKWLQQPAEGE